MPCRTGPKRDRREVWKALKIALGASVLGLTCLSLPSAWADAPAVSPAPVGAFEESACFRLQTQCRVTEGAEPEVLCDRAAFAKALLSCVDLWETENLCAENLSASRDLYSLDLEAWTVKLGELELERDRARLRGWVWLAIGLVGWGAATGLLVWGFAK